jgi:hypothetical protein
VIKEEQDHELLINNNLGQSIQNRPEPAPAPAPAPAPKP